MLDKQFLKILRIFILMATVALMAACGSGDGGGANGNDSGAGGGPPQNGDTAGGDQYGTGPDPVAEPTGNPTSYALIDAAATAGTITTEDALIYKMFATFGDPRLPSQYQGDDTGFIEGDAPQQVLAYIEGTGINNVSAATLDTLRPFFVPAYYEGSWWHQQHPSASQVAMAAATTAANPNCRAWESYCSVLADWKKVEGTNVVVWYLTANETSDLPNATMLVNEFDGEIWPKLTGLMGRTPISDASTGLITAENDGRLDILLVDMPANTEGTTMPSTISGCKAVPAHIYLNRILPQRGLIAVAAHEFMHAIQFSINTAASCLDNYYTIQEATAVWATNFVYPVNDWEQTYAKSYLTGGWVSESYDYRPSEPSLFRYGAYLFPLFLQTRFGPTIVKSIWDKSTVYNQELYAIDGALVAAGSSFEKEWPKFAVANWNRDTINTYFKLDVLVDRADPTEETNFTMPAGGSGSLTHAVSLKHAAASYHRVVFNDPAARSIAIVNGLSFIADSQDLTGSGKTLAFTGLDALNREGASMQVFMKVNGSWLNGATNMTNVMWQLACRDDPAGNIDEIVFIYANAEISSSAPNYDELAPRGKNPGLFVTNIGCRDWTGSLSMSKQLPGGQEKLAISGLRLKNVMPTAAPVPGDGVPAYPLSPADGPVSPGYGWAYAIAEGNATWNYDDNSDGCTRSGSKTFSIGNASMPLIHNSGFTPPGTAERGVLIPGLLSNVLPTVIGLSYDWSCVDPNNGQVTTGNDIVGTNLDIDVAIDDPAVRISTANGLSVSGTGAQSKDAPDATGNWSLQGMTN